MKTIFINLLLCIGFPLLLPAQTGFATITGKIIDSATHVPVGAATVSVQLKNNKPVAVVLSKEDGSFEITGLQNTEYSVVISRAGYQNKTIQANPLFAVFSLGEIQLAAKAGALQPVQVTARQKSIEYGVDKIIYHVDAEAENAFLPVVDILRKLPLITIDADNRVALNGSTHFLVLINNKRSSLFVRHPGDIFKTFTGNAIKSIEVMINPPARFEAEGIGGIINIVLYKNTRGYNGSATAGISNPQAASASGAVTAKILNFGFSGYLGTNSSHPPTIGSELFRENMALQSRLQQTGQSRSNTLTNYGGGEFSYELDSLNLLTVDGSFNNSNGASHVDKQAGLFKSNGQFIGYYAYQNTGSNQWNGSDIGVDYQHRFATDKDHLLTLSYKKTGSNNTGDFHFIREWLNLLTKDENRTANTGVSKENTLQADYVNTVKGLPIEAGIKTIFRSNTSDYNYQHLYPMGFVRDPDPNKSNHFQYRQNVYAAYGSVSKKKNDWRLKAGVRIELTTINKGFKTLDTILHSRYLNVLPSLLAIKNLNDNNSLQFSFAQRMERPGLYFLDPYTDFVDPRNISLGNPNLQPVINNSLAATYNYFANASHASLMLFYNFSNRSIERFTTIVKDTVARTTFGNIDKSSAIGIALNSSATLLKKLNVNLNGNASYTRFTGAINNVQQNNSGMVYTLFSNVDYRLKDDLRISGSIGYNTVEIMFQGKRAGYLSHSLGLTKYLLKNKVLSASFTASNPFQYKRHSFTEIFDPAFYQLQQAAVVVRQFTLSVGYRFGQLQEDIVQNKRRINNNDLKVPL